MVVGQNEGWCLKTEGGVSKRVSKWVVGESRGGGTKQVSGRLKRVVGG